MNIRWNQGLVTLVEYAVLATSSHCWELNFVHLPDVMEATIMRFCHRSSFHVVTRITILKLLTLASGNVAMK